MPGFRPGELKNIVKSAAAGRNRPIQSPRVRAIAQGPGAKSVEYLLKVGHA
jgi:hypothetical protein